MDADGEFLQIDVVAGPAHLLDRTGGHHLGGDARLLQGQVALQQLVLGDPQSQRHQPPGGVQRPEYAPVGMVLDVVEQQRRTAHVGALADAGGYLEARVHLPVHLQQLALALQHVKEFSQVLMQCGSPVCRSLFTGPRGGSPRPR